MYPPQAIISEIYKQPLRIGQSLIPTYVTECMTTQGIGRILDHFCKDIHLYVAFTQSHRPEEAITDSYNKCGPGFILIS